MKKDEQAKEFEDLTCPIMWKDLVIDLKNKRTKFCCRTPGVTITDQMLEVDGKDVFLNNSFFQQHRREILQGVRPDACSECWVLEDKGVKSYRQDLNEFYIAQGKDWKNFLWDAKSVLNVRADNPNVLNIFISNLCDLKCIYCSEEHSTTWAKANKKNRTQTKSDTSTQDSKLEEHLWLWLEDNLETIDILLFAGGEPTIENKFYIFLEKLMDHVKSRPEIKLEIHVTSNMNTPPKYFKRFIKIIEGFGHQHNFVIDASLDLPGKRGEYIRTNLSFKRWHENVSFLLNERKHNRLKFNLTIIPTISLFSIIYLDQLIEYVFKLRKKYGYMINLQKNVINHPVELSPYRLPWKMSKYINRSVKKIEAQVVKWEQSAYVHDFPNKWTDYKMFLIELEASIKKNKKEIGSEQFYKFIKSMETKKSFLLTFPRFYAHYLKSKYFSLVEKSNANNTR